jgi:TPR repeat protein
MVVINNAQFIFVSLKFYSANFVGGVLVKSVKLYIFGFLLCVNTVAFGQLTPEQQSAKDTGMGLYLTYGGDEGAESLLVSAAAGDRESQYVLGEMFSRGRRGEMRLRATYWYELAARQGDYYSMVRLAKGLEPLCVTLNDCGFPTKKASEWFKIAEERCQG